MKRIKFPVIVIIVVACVTLFFGCGYNSMVGKQEAVTSQWGQVQNVYQRRADLIPNLVSTVKGYAKHESETFQAVTEARAGATQIKIDANDLTPEKLKEFQQAQAGVGAALNKLLVLRENYPDLKANQNFLDLQSQLEGTENRITVERQKFNDAVRDYNAYIRKFPQVIYAGWFGFSQKVYFEAELEAEKAPVVSFE